MSDIIWGKVTEVIDGDTFDVNVTHYQKGNSYTYNNYERIRIASKNAPEMGSLGGAVAKIQLETKISGRSVKLAIHSRDTYQRLVCNVTLDQP